MLVCDEVNGLPVYAKTYKGNVADVSTVKNLLTELKVMFSRVKGADSVSPTLTFVTDRGYDSEDNLQLFLIHNYNFVMRSMLRSAWVKDIVFENYSELMDDNSLDIYTSQHKHTAKVEYKYDSFPVDGKRKSNKDSADIYVHMFFDEQIKTPIVQPLKQILPMPVMNTMLWLKNSMRTMKLSLLKYSLKSALIRNSISLSVTVLLMKMAMQ